MINVLCARICLWPKRSFLKMGEVAAAGDLRQCSGLSRTDMTAAQQVTKANFSGRKLMANRLLEEWLYSRRKKLKPSRVSVVCAGDTFDQHFKPIKIPILETKDYPSPQHTLKVSLTNAPFLCSAPCPSSPVTSPIVGFCSAVNLNSAKPSSVLDVFLEKMKHKCGWTA